VEARSNAIECEVQLGDELNEVVKKEMDKKLTQKFDVGRKLEQFTMTPMEGIALDGTSKPTIEEYPENLKSNGGLNESRHAPNSRSQNAPPTGPKCWRERLAKKTPNLKGNKYGWGK
jgi:hypothetical protein